MKKVETKIIEYRGEKILLTAGLYFYNAHGHRTEKKAKTAIDNKLKEDNLGNPKQYNTDFGKFWK